MDHPPTDGYRYKIRKIVLDAGHGGHDPGCLGKTSKEKDNTLAIVLKLGALIEKHMPDVEVIYTRKTDVFIELDERSKIANRNNADLFISVHCNMIQGKPGVQGTETYVMGMEKTKANLNVAMRENSAVLKEKDYEEKYNGFDPTSPEGMIIMSMYQNAYMDKSISLANKVESQFIKTGKRKSRGVKQNVFYVLWRCMMPSVLIETGYLNNAEDEKLLSTPDGQYEVAMCILKAIQDYRAEAEIQVAGINIRNELGDAEHTTPDVSVEPVLTKGKEEVREANPLPKDPPRKAAPVSKPEADAPADLARTDGPRFYVQLASMPQQIDISQSNLKHVKALTVVQEEGRYRYLIDGISSFESAEKAKAEAIKRGFKDAFIVAYHKGKRIALAEAKALVK